MTFVCMTFFFLNFILADDEFQTLCFKFGLELDEVVSVEFLTIQQLTNLD